CLSNCKQIGTAMLMYVQDYDERFPFLYGGSPTKTTIQLVHPYVNNLQVWNCPSAAQEVDITASGEPGTFDDRSYAWNRYLIHIWSTKPKMARIARPASIVLIADAIQDSWGPGRLYPPSSANYNEAIATLDLPAACDDSIWDTGAMGDTRPGFNVIPRHNGMANVTFVDGHAKAMTYDVLWNNGDPSEYFGTDYNTFD
ncbi:MAG: hypothetical protein ACOCX2_09360, partial [Armatimonadota bacterium]